MHVSNTRRIRTEVFALCPCTVFLFYTEGDNFELRPPLNQRESPPPPCLHYHWLGDYVSWTCILDIMGYGQKSYSKLSCNNFKIIHPCCVIKAVINVHWRFLEKKKAWSWLLSRRNQSPKNLYCKVVYESILNNISWAPVLPYLVILAQISVLLQARLS
jgi:hypothetical protein